MFTGYLLLNCQPPCEHGGVQLQIPLQPCAEEMPIEGDIFPAVASFKGVKGILTRGLGLGFADVLLCRPCESVVFPFA